MFKKMMVLCLVVACIVSSLNIIIAKAEQVCGAEEYQNIMNKTAEIYGEAGIMEYTSDSIVSIQGNKKYRLLVKYKCNFKKRTCTGVAIYSTGKKISVKLNFTYNINTNKIECKEIINKDILALAYTKNFINLLEKGSNAIDVVDGSIDMLSADDSNVVEKTKNGFKGTVVDSLNIKVKFDVAISNGFKNITINKIISKDDIVGRIKVTVRKIG